MTQPIETIAVGQTIPQVNFKMKLDDGINTFSTTDYFKDSRVVLFVVPGAFTPTCSAKHLPGFVKLADKFKAAGIDKIACMAVNESVCPSGRRECAATPLLARSNPDSRLCRI